MSLVAYASSGDESGSDVEEANACADNKINYQHSEISISNKVSEDVSEKDDIPISDEEDDIIPSTLPSSATGLSLPAPQHSKAAISQTKAQDSSSTDSSFLVLPKPKSESNVEEVEDELEDFVKEKTEKLKAVAAAEAKPLKPKKRKIIQIAAPTLSKSDSEDEDTDQPKSKRAISAAGPLKKSGLFSVLPAPKNKSLGGGKEVSEREKMFDGLFSKKTTAKTESVSKQPSKDFSEQKTTATLPKVTAKSSAPFVPASVTRKPNMSNKTAFNLETGIMMRSSHLKKKPASQAADTSGTTKTDFVTKTKVTVPMTKVKGLPGVPVDDDSSDEEGGDSANFFSLGGDRSAPNPLSASAMVATASTSTLPAVGSKDAGTAGPSMALENKPLSFQSRGNNIQDAPLKFERTRTNVQTSAYAPPAGSMGAYSNAYYNMANMEETPAYDPEAYEMAAEQSFSQDEEFLKMQGKSNRRKEEINIIDVRQSDQTVDVDMNMVKSLSEENANRLSYSKKNNDNMPTGQQKRKHQITYLAFKAKEREVELKDAWAANRSTKRQTQSKYGF